MTIARQPVRICMLSSSHPVEYSRFLDREAVSLCRAGHDVAIVGLGPSDGERVEQGKRLVAHRRQSGLAKLGLLRRIERDAKRLEPQVYHCLDPWTLDIGLRLKRSRRHVRVVYEASEWFARAYSDRDDLGWPVRQLAAARVRLLERRACRQADLIVETNRTRAERFTRQGVTPVLVPNYPPLELLPALTERREPWIAWTGLMSRPRGFHRLLEALADVRDQHPGVQLHVAGSFDPRDDIEEWSRRFVAGHRLGGAVVLHGTMRYDAALSMLGRCRIGVVLLQPERGNDFTGQPNKLFEFMGAGLAIIVSDFPEIGRVVREHDCGILVDPRDPHAIASALNAALAQPGRCRAQGLAGARAVAERYNWARAEAVLLDAYSGLMR